MTPVELGGARIGSAMVLFLFAALKKHTVHKPTLESVGCYWMTWKDGREFVMFGTSGIRGTLDEITPLLAIELGRALASAGYKQVLVARDTRTSGEMLEAALCAGITACGGDVLRAGIAPTPAVALAAKQGAGVAVTASHNPPQYNGFKFFKQGGEFGGAQRSEIERLLKSRAFAQARWDRMGSEEAVSVVRGHIDAALSLVDTALIARKRPKVIVDAGNGAGCVATPYALREAGCRVIAVNAEPSGFFNRGLEPTEENLAETAKITAASGAGLAVAHDGDADRCIALGGNGGFIGLDRQLALVCRHMLEHERCGTIVTTVEASLAVKEAIEGAGGNALLTCVGSVNIAEQIERSGAIFGGEPCGEYVFPRQVLVPDGVLAALVLAEIHCRHGPLQKLAKSIPVYPIARLKIPSENKHEAMRRMAQEIVSSFKGDVNAQDGIRVDSDDGWLLVRASGTEPAIRITCECKRKAVLGKMRDKAERIVRRYA